MVYHHKFGVQKRGGGVQPDRDAVQGEPVQWGYHSLTRRNVEVVDEEPHGHVVQVHGVEQGGEHREGLVPLVL